MYFILFGLLNVSCILDIFQKKTKQNRNFFYLTITIYWSHEGLEQEIQGWTQPDVDHSSYYHWPNWKGIVIMPAPCRDFIPVEKSWEESIGHIVSHAARQLEPGGGILALNFHVSRCDEALEEFKHTIVFQSAINLSVISQILKAVQNVLLWLTAA